MPAPSGAFQAALKRGVRRSWWIADQVSPALAEGPGFGKVAGYRIRTGALPAFQAAVATHQQGELASQKDCLAEAITGEGGEWDAQRSVAALHEIGHAVDEKRARGRVAMGAGLPAHVHGQAVRKALQEARASAP